MKLTVEVFTVRNIITSKLLHAKALNDMYDEVNILYPYSSIPSLEDLRKGISNFPESTKKDCYFRYGEKLDISIQCEAKDAPSIGHIECGMENYELQIPDFLEKDGD